jgi:hypothetical protein
MIERIVAPIKWRIKLIVFTVKAAGSAGSLNALFAEDDECKWFARRMD